MFAFGIVYTSAIGLKQHTYKEKQKQKALVCHTLGESTVIFYDLILFQLRLSLSSHFRTPPLSQLCAIFLIEISFHLYVFM